MSIRSGEKRRFVSLLLLLLTLPLCSQELDRSAPTVVGAEPQAFFDRRTLLAVTNPGYLVSPGDVYTLSYNREQVRVTQHLVVDPDMTVDLSIFGKESVDNLTFIEFRRLVQKKVLTAYPTGLPQVTIRATGSSKSC